MSISIYPNPFSELTTIQFNINQADKYKIRVFDLLGNEVYVMLDKYFTKGEYEVVWDGQNQNGKKITSGIYFIEMAGKRERKVVKVILK